MLESRKQNKEGFYGEFELNADRSLTNIFWRGRKMKD